MILDVGCGKQARGTVNIDLYPKEIEHRVRRERLNCHIISNFVVADAQHLPFKSHSFTEVCSSHVLEHIKNPYLMIREMLRVAKQKVLIEVPHMWNDVFHLRKKKYHINFFRSRWFHQSFKNFIHTVKINYKPFPHPLFPIMFLPYSITITIYKKV